MPESITFTLNGQSRTLEAEGIRPLLEVLREEFHLTGTKYGCGEAQCGACSVLVDGKRVFSCRTPFQSVAGKAVTTIEGLSVGDALHPVQQAFLEAGAYQCGYCIPGMIISTVAFLKEHPKPSDEEITAGMNRNMCRCCGYVNIIAAIKKAAGTA